jgi:hypothetical protein
MQEQKVGETDVVDGRGSQHWTLREVLALLFSNRGPFSSKPQVRKPKLLDRYGRPLH